MTCRKSSTGVSLPVPGGLAAAAGTGGAERGVADPAGDLPVVLVAEQGQVVDAGRAGGVIAGQRLGAGLGVRVPGDVVRGRGPGVLPARPHLQHGQVKWVEDQLDPPPGQHRVGPGTGCRAWTRSRSWTRSAILTSGTPRPRRRARGRGTGCRLPTAPAAPARSL